LDVRPSFPFKVIYIISDPRLPDVLERGRSVAVLCCSRGCSCILSFWLCTPPSLAWCNKKLSLWTILLCRVYWNSWESESCLLCKWWL